MKKKNYRKLLTDGWRKTEMILVDVFVPSLSNHYEFQLDEAVKIELLIDEIAEMICQKEHCNLAGKKSELCLCKYQGESIMKKQTTLSQNQVIDGSRLILV